MTIYLDSAATTPVRRAVLEAMWPYLTTTYGNPASHHELGAAAAHGLTAARKSVATMLGARPAEVTFTSGGTEGANTAIKGIALADPRGRHIIVSAVEHPAVLESARWLGRLGFAVTELAVDAEGRVRPATLAAALRPDTTLVSIQYANNEVGTIQPIIELSALTRAVGVPFHTDAVQAAGWLDLDVDRLGVHALSISGHKLGAPKGIGALYLRSRTPIEPLIHGGGQQRGLRSGTEDVAGAVGLATALQHAQAADLEAVRARRDLFVTRVLAAIPAARLTGAGIGVSDVGKSAMGEFGPGFGSDRVRKSAMGEFGGGVGSDRVRNSAMGEFGSGAGPDPVRKSAMGEFGSGAGPDPVRKSAMGEFGGGVGSDRVRNSAMGEFAEPAPSGAAGDCESNRESRLPGHASFVIPGISGESILLDLERRGIICSSGSACAAGSDEPSHVLTAMGIPAEVAQTALRFSFEADLSESDLQQSAEALVAAVNERLPQP